MTIATLGAMGNLMGGEVVVVVVGTAVGAGAFVSG
jgi:hypothetical protein